MKKPAKPAPDFPLFAHGNGQWAKKVNGRLRYFGPWRDPQAALARFLGPTPEASNGHQQVVSEQKSVPDSPRPVKDRPDKPTKPYPDFPLFPHDTGRWAKKIRGKTHFFGPLLHEGLQIVRVDPILRSPILLLGHVVASQPA